MNNGSLLPNYLSRINPGIRNSNSSFSSDSALSKLEEEIISGLKKAKLIINASFHESSQGNLAYMEYGLRPKQNSRDGCIFLRKCLQILMEKRYQEVEISYKPENEKKDIYRAEILIISEANEEREILLRLLNDVNELIKGYLTIKSQFK